MPILGPPESELWQGDVFEGVPWSVIRQLDYVQPTGEHGRYLGVPPPPSGGRGRLVTASGSGLGMLLSHECVVDKGGMAPLTFARVLPITTYGERGRDAIRQGANYQTFHIPRVDGVLDESYVDFRLVAAIDPQLLGRFRRIASLTEEGRASLRLQMILYWTRLEPAG